MANQLLKSYIKYIGSNERIDEFLPFMQTPNPATGSVTSQPQTNTSTGSQSQPISVEKEPWQMSQQEVRGLPHQELINKFWKPAAEHIWKQSGSRDWKRIVDYYSKKYRLPDINVDTTNQLPPNVNGEAVKDGSGQWTIKMSPRLQMSDYEAAIVLRHEIEHVIDSENYRFNATKDKAIEHPTAGGIEVEPGHHKHFSEFNTDYAHRIVVRDAIKSGKDVPQEIKRQYPGI